MSSTVNFHPVPFTEFDRLFDGAFSPRSLAWPIAPLAVVNGCSGTQPLESFRPRLDLQDSKDSNVVTATFELPGLTSENVVIEVHNNRLTISGESSTSKDSDGSGYVVRERQHGKFSRSLQLPLGTKSEDVNAKMEHGVLRVTFPRATPTQPQRIAIQ